MDNYKKKFIEELSNRKEIIEDKQLMQGLISDIVHDDKPFKNQLISAYNCVGYDLCAIANGKEISQDKLIKKFENETGYPIEICVKVINFMFYIFNEIFVKNTTSYGGEKKVEENTTGLKNKTISKYTSFPNKNLNFAGNSTIEFVKVSECMTEIAKNAFANNTCLSEIIFSKNIDKIKTKAFLHCPKLKSVMLPLLLTVICKDAFAFSGIEEIIIPDSVTLIEEGAFRHCKNLKRVVLSKNLISISAYAFCGCINLIEVILPKGIKSIKESAFSGCKELTEISIPSSVKTIDKKVFHGCIKLGNYDINGKSNAKEDSIIDIKTKMKSNELQVSNIKIGFDLEVEPPHKVVKGGLLSEWQGIRVFIPNSHLTLKGAKRTEKYLDKKLKLRVIEIDDQKIVASRRVLLEEKKSNKEKTWNEISPNDIVIGQVKNIVDFGVFVNVGGIHCLLRTTDVSWQKNTKASDLFEVNKTYEFIILKVNREDKKIYLGYKQLQERPEKYIEKVNFGYGTIGSKLLKKYISILANIFDEYQLLTSEDFSLIKGMSNRCIRHDQHDWFATYECLGEPLISVLHSFSNDCVSNRDDLRKGANENVVMFREKYHEMLSLALSNFKKMNVSNAKKHD